MYELEFFGLELKFETCGEVFSPKYADPGTLAMLRCARPFLTLGTKTLDLGCGCGIAGITAAMFCGAENIVMSDILPAALELSGINARLNGLPVMPKIIESYGFSSIDDTGFGLILSNPPYHTDFSVPKEFIEKGFNRLALGGKLVMVTKRLDWYKNKISAVFGGVKIIQDSGYYVFIGERRRYKRGANV